MQYVAGSVPYVNARPLVSYFEHLGDSSPVKLLYTVPSQLPALLDSGTCHVAMASSFEALRTPGRKIADAGCVGTIGEVQSVRLFSKVPFGSIRTLALDASSLTSVHLGQILLSERYGVSPETIDMQPDLRTMLETNDACLIIGDKGMLADGSGLQVMDLGLEWRELTGLPFVWAAWIGSEGLTEELSSHLARAQEWGEKHMDEVVGKTQVQVRWPGDSCRDYLTRIMSYRLTDEHLAGLQAFHRYLLKHRFVQQEAFPEIVSSHVLSGTPRLA